MGKVSPDLGSFSDGGKPPMRPILSMALFLLVALATGCAGVGGYAEDRANDFADCFSLQGGLGFPAAFEIRATDWVAIGAGLAVAVKWGIEGRKPVTSWGAISPDGQVGLPLLPFVSWVFGPLEPCEKDGIFAYFYTYYSEKCAPIVYPPSKEKARTITKSIVLFDMTSIPTFRCPPEESGRGLVQAFDLHLDATLGVSARVGFSPGQFADLMLGLFTIDIAGDDSQGAGEA